MRSVSKKKPKLFLSFFYALRGLGFVIASERNMQIHVGVGLLVIALGVWLHVSLIEWMVLSLSIGLVLVTEAVNTAIEISIDLVTKKQKIRAMLSKDIAAGAVLLASLQALVVAYFIFFHRLYNVLF